MSHGIARHTVVCGIGVLVLGVCVPMSEAGRGQGQVRVNQDAQLSVEFLKRVEAYVELHNKVESTIPPRPKNPTPEQIDSHERALGRLIAQTRTHAKQGDLFTQPTRAYFRRQIVRALSTPDAAAVKDSIMEENPGPIKLEVNGRYPDEVPLATMPPQVLAALPKLPPDIEYRFIGSRLILLDVHAQIVVDFIEDALPK